MARLIGQSALKPPINQPHTKFLELYSKIDCSPGTRSPAATARIVNCSPYQQTLRHLRASDRSLTRARQARHKSRPKNDLPAMSAAGLGATHRHKHRHISSPRRLLLHQQESHDPSPADLEHRDEALCHARGYSYFYYYRCCGCDDRPAAEHTASRRPRRGSRGPPLDMYRGHRPLRPQLLQEPPGPRRARRQRVPGVALAVSGRAEEGR